jgi:hypothetical protein
MPATYEPIATTTLGSAATTVTFSSISSTYTDLILVAAPLSSAAEELVMQFNGDTSAVYSATIVWGSGSSAGSVRSTGQNSAVLNYYASVGGTQNTQIFNVMNYANTTTFKTIIGRAGRSDSGVDATVALWRNTSAINSVALKLKNSNNFLTGSTFTLYGVKSA